MIGHRSFRTMLMLFTFAPALAAAQDVDGRPISLPDAIKLAELNQPSTVAARNALRTGDAAVRASLFQFLPNLSFSYTGAEQGGSTFFQGKSVPYTGLPWSYSRGLTTNLTLFDGNQRYYNYKASESNMDAFIATEVNQRYGVALSVKQQYYAILAARESDAAAQRTLEQAQQQLKVSVAKMIVGAATRADSLTSAIAVGNARLLILNARTNMRNANAALTRLVASTSMVTALPSDTSETGMVTFDEAALTQLVSDGPAVRQATAALMAANAQHKAATTPYYPTLSTSYSYSQSPEPSPNFNFGSGQASANTNFRLSLSYNIFNNFTREQALVVARVNADNADANLRDAKFFVQQNLTTQISNLRTAQETIQLQLLTIQQANEALRVVQQRYNLGAAALLEVLQAEASLDNARAALIQARLNARTAKAQIEALIGRDLQ